MASEAENVSIETDNVSNLTGRAAATVGGIALTYSSLFLMALGPIILGSIRSVTHHSTLKVILTVFLWGQVFLYDTRVHTVGKGEHIRSVRI